MGIRTWFMIAATIYPGVTLAQGDMIPPADRTPGISKIIRGTTECREPALNNAPCATEYWTMYVHKDGSRYMHVVSDNFRAGEARHAMVWVDPEGETREAYMNNWSTEGVLGSAYVVKRDESADVAASDIAFERADEGVVVENVEAFDRLDSLGVGPASADGLHFLNYNFDAPGEQPHGIYWMGGSRHGTMVGNIVTSEYTYLGEQELTLKDGKIVVADHFRMISGTEVWLTKEDRAMLKMDLKFGNVDGSIFETVSFDIDTPER
jgi:hypothetical protein